MALQDPALVIGTNSAVETSTRVRWSLHRGEYQERTWRGPASALWDHYIALKAYAAYVPDYDEITFSLDAGRAVVTATRNQGTVVGGLTYGGSGINAEPRYEMRPNEERVPIEYHPLFGDISEDDLALVIDAGRHRTIAYNTAWNGTSKETLYKLLLRGVDDYPATTYVLRETRVVSKRSNLAAAFDDVDSCVALPSTALTEALVASDIPSCDWLKRCPSVAETERGRWEIVTEYWGIPNGLQGPVANVGRQGWSNALFGGNATP